MSELRKVRCYASVDQPYGVVRASLHRLPLARVAELPAHVCTISDDEGEAGLPPLTRVALDWGGRAASAAHALTSAEIYASPESASKTQLEIEGHWCTAPDAPTDPDPAQAADACIHALLESLLEGLRKGPRAPCPSEADPPASQLGGNASRR